MPKKIIFMGTPMFAVPILKSLYQKSQRGMKILKSPIQGIAETLNIEFRTPKTLKDNHEELEYFKKIEADLAIVVAYGQIIPKEFLNLTKKGFCIELENQALGTVVGQGILHPEKISWEFRLNHLGFEGFELSFLALFQVLQCLLNLLLLLLQ